MYDFFAPKKLGAASAIRFAENRETRTAFLLFLLFLGVLFGAVIGTYAADALPGSRLFADMYAGSELKFLSALWDCSKFFLLLALCATGYLGIAAVPALVLLRGYLLGCTSAAAYAAESFGGLAAAFFVCGVSALLSVPALILTASDSMESSMNLLRLRFYRRAFPRQYSGALRRAIIALLLICVDTLYTCFLMPRFLALL